MPRVPTEPPALDIPHRPPPPPPLPRLWHNADGTGRTWKSYSLSYWHNRLEPNASLHFDAKVNASTARESTSYTSLIATGPTSGFVVYARHLPPSPDVAFSMPFSVA